MGAFAGSLLGSRFDPAGQPVAFAIFGAWFVALIVGFATDLDQRILPDETTLPVIPVALVYDLTGQNPLVGDQVVLAIAIAVIVPLGLFLLSLPFGDGAFGEGDVKLLAGVGLMLGLTRGVTALIAGLLSAGLVLAVLLGTRRINRRSYVPYGPFLIFGALWGIFITP